MDTDFREVVVQIMDENDLLDVTVVVGDGVTVYDEDFEYDQRVFFYFQDEAEFASAWVDYEASGGFFKIVRYAE
jgi:hypothetical protein